MWEVCIGGSHNSFNALERCFTQPLVSNLIHADMQNFDTAEDRTVVVVAFVTKDKGTQRLQ
jgi:hypothetical protein